MEAFVGVVIVILVPAGVFIMSVFLGAILVQFLLSIVSAVTRGVKRAIAIAKPHPNTIFVSPKYKVGDKCVFLANSNIIKGRITHRYISIEDSPTTGFMAPQRFNKGSANPKITYTVQSPEYLGGLAYEYEESELYKSVAELVARNKLN